MVTARRGLAGASTIRVTIANSAAVALAAVPRAIFTLAGLRVAGIDGAGIVIVASGVVGATTPGRIGAFVGACSVATLVGLAWIAALLDPTTLVYLCNDAVPVVAANGAIGPYGARQRSIRVALPIIKVRHCRARMCATLVNGCPGRSTIRIVGDDAHMAAIVPKVAGLAALKLNCRAAIGCHDGPDINEVSIKTRGAASRESQLVRHPVRTSRPWDRSPPTLIRSNVAIIPDETTARRNEL